MVEFLQPTDHMADCEHLEQTEGVVEGVERFLLAGCKFRYCSTLIARRVLLAEVEANRIGQRKQSERT
ncbi:MAG TPA: hypothetical protein EYQ80_01645 [Candidatus Poseidoniales archaeon]|nr:hypothetical protein [Candidatus Poseidoniales archaeon]